MMPNGWVKTHLKNILSQNIRNGYSPLPAEQVTGYWVLGLGALTDNKLDISEIKPVRQSNKVTCSLLEDGDFLVSRSNTPDKVGRSALFRGEIKNCSYPDLMMKFRVNDRKIIPEYLEQFLQSHVIRSYFSTHASGSSSTMVKINKATLEKTPIILPPLKEQDKITKIFATWDKAITSTEKLIVNSEQQKKALMQQLLTGKKRLLDENGVRFSGEWEPSELQKISTITKGKQLNKSTLTKTGLYPVINGGIEPSGYSQNYNTDANTITISEGGNSCGFIGYQTSNFWCGGHCYYLSKLKINTQTLFQILKFNEPKIMKLRVGSGLPNIQKKAIESYSIYYPNQANEQEKIAEVLSNADREIELLKAKLEHLQQEKKALMQQLLTGKRRVVIN